MDLNTSTVQILSHAEFQEVGYDVMKQVFRNDDPFNEPFADWVSNKMLLCEFIYELTSPLLEAMIKAASSFGDKGFFVSLLVDIGVSEPHHWYVPFEDIEAYKKITSLWVENVVFSPNANWGLISSPEDFAIIGGKQGFINMLQNLIPGITEQVDEFLVRRQLESQRHLRVDWVPHVLRHVFGEKTADAYLQVYGLK